jgi:hypothetical protein
MFCLMPHPNKDRRSFRNNTALWVNKKAPSCTSGAFGSISKNNDTHSGISLGGLILTLSWGYVHPAVDEPKNRKQEQETWQMVDFDSCHA